ncbi:MAG: DUF3662 and FHA domain-containing protein [Actinomycetales bacterium]|nr:DUF3662 and FHA domain-containing protein [Actinomycetales bacterium]
MGILDSFERGLERAVNGAFARTFKSGLQPLEVTSALRRELDTKSAVVARDRILAPNRFVVHLAPSDHERFAALGPTLLDEFTQLVQQHAVAQHYSFAGGLDIRLQRDERLAEGTVDIESGSVQSAVEWTPVLEIGSTRRTLPRGRTILGRGSEADVTIDDTGASRRHVEILWDGERGQITDLGSTNGTRLNGAKLGAAPLPPDSVIEIGRTRIVFRVLAQAASADPSADLRMPKAP